MLKWRRVEESGAFGEHSLKTVPNKLPVLVVTLAQHTNCCIFAFCLLIIVFKFRFLFSIKTLAY